MLQCRVFKKLDFLKTGRTALNWNINKKPLIFTVSYIIMIFIRQYCYLTLKFYLKNNIKKKLKHLTLETSFCFLFLSYNSQL
jgi:hypothetical protein